MNEEIIDANLSNSNMVITPEIKSYLQETAKWSKFLAIVGFVFMAIFVLIGLGISFFAGSLFSGIEDEMTRGLPIGLGSVGFIYVLMALLYIMPLLYMYRFANNMKRALANNNQQELSDSFRNLKSLYKFMGILTAIVVGFYALIFVFVILGGVAAAAF